MPFHAENTQAYTHTSNVTSVCGLAGFSVDPIHYYLCMKIKRNFHAACEVHLSCIQTVLGTKSEIPS